MAGEQTGWHTKPIAAHVEKKVRACSETIGTTRMRRQQCSLQQLIHRTQQQATRAGGLQGVKRAVWNDRSQKQADVA